MLPWYGHWTPWGLSWHRRLCFRPYAWAWGTPSREEEIAILKEGAIVLELELERVKRRIEKLNKQEVKNA